MGELSATSASPARRRPGTLVLQRRFHAGRCTRCRRIRASVNVLAVADVAARSRCRCPAATTSVPARSTCTSPARADGATFAIAHGELFPGRAASSVPRSRCRSPCRGHRESRHRCGLADGETVIDNAARAEVVDLCDFSEARATSGHGTSLSWCTASNAGALRAANHRTVPDRIQAATTRLGSRWPAADRDRRRPDHINASPASVTWAWRSSRATTDAG